MTTMIPFNKPTVTGREAEYIQKVFNYRKFSGDGPMSQHCNNWLKTQLGGEAVLVTSSCTHALEMAALLCDVKPGDEVILPSFGFSSTAAAFVRAGASLVYVDIEPSTMNVDVKAVENAINDKTRVVVALHYAGVACNMNALSLICARNNLFLVEDAAQAIFSNYGNRALGTIGTFGCISFHESKNIHCGEGGALIINDRQYIERAEIILEKGTNRADYRRGTVSKYTWCDIGSSYLLSDLNCAFLLAQLEAGKEITNDRLRIWREYRIGVQELVDREVVEVPGWHGLSQSNGHIFWIKLENIEERDRLLSYLHERRIMATFHYVPLHSSPAGARYGRFSGADRFTSSGAERLLRLPIYFGFREWDRVLGALREFFRGRCQPRSISMWKSSS